jgi:hypothetical protein
MMTHLEPYSFAITKTDFDAVTATAIADNYVQMPFKHQWKLFISDIPYEVSVDGGDNITNWNHGGNSVGVALRQLGTLKTGKLSLIGSHARARPRNSFIVMISVPQDSAANLNSFLKALSKVCSIGVFAVGTALFASSQFLSLLMACMAITVILCAAVFGRQLRVGLSWASSKVSPWFTT